MTPPTSPETADIETIAGRLSEARKAMILALPSDGSWGKVPSRSVAKRAWWAMIPGVIEHKHCPEDAREWCLSDIGIAVAAHLRSGDPQ